MKNNNLNSYQTLLCSKCGRIVDNVGETAVKATCSYCVLMAVGFPSEPMNKTYKPTGRPPGWHWMSEFVDKDGNVFRKGKEMPKLKGTLKPTKVKPPKKKIKRRTKEQILIDRHNEKKAVLKKAVKKQQDFINHNIDKG
jgi:hypothetical protein